MASLRLISRNLIWTDTWRAATLRILEHQARRKTLETRSAQDHAVVFACRGDLLDGKGLLHGRDNGIELLRIAGFGKMQFGWRRSVHAQCASAAYL